MNLRPHPQPAGSLPPGAAPRSPPRSAPTRARLQKGAALPFFTGSFPSSFAGHRDRGTARILLAQSCRAGGTLDWEHPEKREERGKGGRSSRWRRGGVCGDVPEEEQLVPVSGAAGIGSVAVGGAAAEKSPTGTHWGQGRRAGDIAKKTLPQEPGGGHCFAGTQCSPIQGSGNGKAASLRGEEAAERLPGVPDVLHRLVPAAFSFPACGQPPPCCQCCAAARGWLRALSTPN